jgi:dipeptidyl aminopeptidase/acylaminoacyl peptidase
MAPHNSWFVLAGLAVAGCVGAATSAPSVASVSSRELVEIVDIDSLSASPDGRFLLFRTVQADLGRNSYVLRWHSADPASGTVRDIGSGGEPIYLDPGSVQPEKILWLGGAGPAVFRGLFDGAVGLWQADVGGGRTRPLIVRDADIEDYSLSPDGRTLLYRVGPSREEIRRAEQREHDEGILVDSSIDLGQNLFRGGSVSGRMASQRLVGYWYVRDGLLWKAPRQQRSFDPATGADRPVGSPRAVESFQLPKMGAAAQVRNGDGAVAEASWDGTSGSLTATLAGGRTLRCADPRCSSGRISALAWRPGTEDVLVTLMDRERRQSLALWSTAGNRLRNLTENDGLLSGGRRHMVPCAVSNEAAFCVAAGPASPPRLERIDLGSGERTVLFDPNVGIRARYRPEVRYLRWPLADGREAAGVLLRPAGSQAGRAPMYLNYYACEGFLRGGEGDEWPIPELLDAGFVVACVNAVPSTGPQDALADYRAALSAVRALVGKLSDEGMVDRSKVAMGGLSFGSEVAFWVATHSDLLAALSITSPQPEPASYWLSAMTGSDIPATLRRVWGLGAPDETPERWRLLSPALSAGKIRIPVLFQMPEMEARRVPELFSRLAGQGTPTELYAFPDEAHIKVQPRHRLAVYQRNLDWFRYWLQGHRDPDPGKAEQYRRWDRLGDRKRSADGTHATTAATARAQPAP